MSTETVPKLVFVKTNFGLLENASDVGTARADESECEDWLLCIFFCYAFFCKILRLSTLNAVDLKMNR